MRKWNKEKEKKGENGKAHQRAFGKRLFHLSLLNQSTDKQNTKLIRVTSELSGGRLIRKKRKLIVRLSQFLKTRR